MKRALLLAAVLALPPGFAKAADPCTGVLSSAQIVSCFAGAPKARGFPHARGIAIEGDKPAGDETSVNLMVGFEFNSAELDNDGMIALDALGKALSDPSLSANRFRIAGHTDAVGSDAYNQKLSEARAEAVRGYLAQHYQLAPRRFEVAGFGKTRLADPTNPTAAINRRVEVTKLK